MFAGALVMPFAILLEMTNQYWLFGHDWWVTLFISLASILCVKLFVSYSKFLQSIIKGRKQKFEASQPHLSKNVKKKMAIEGCSQIFVVSLL